MKILQVISTWKGGAIRVAFDAAKALSHKGHKVTIYATDVRKENKDLDEEVIDNVHSLHALCPVLAKKAKFYFTPEVISLAKNVQCFDVLHLHEYRTFQNIIFHFYATKYGVPYVLQAHGSLPSRVAKQSLKWIYDVFFGYRLLRDASKVIALSPKEGEQYRAMGVPEEKIEVIPNGIDLSEYGDLPPKGDFKKRFGIERDEKIVLYLGRIHRGKGIDFLIKAYSCLLSSANIRDTLLVIAGPDDGYLSEAKSLVSSHGLSRNVLFTGMLSQKDKTSAYVDSKVLINAEPSNVFGLVPLEAAACRTPVIVSDKNAISEPVLKGGFGFSVKYGDVAELAEIMKRMLINEDLLRQMGRKGREFTFRNFNWSNLIAEFEKVYEEAVTGAK